jgi:hypothetical protein
VCVCVQCRNNIFHYIYLKAESDKVDQRWCSACALSQHTLVAFTYARRFALGVSPSLRALWSKTQLRVEVTARETNDDAH